MEGTRGAKAMSSTSLATLAFCLCSRLSILCISTSSTALQVHRRTSRVSTPHATSGRTWPLLLLIYSIFMVLVISTSYALRRPSLSHERGPLFLILMQVLLVVELTAAVALLLTSAWKPQVPSTTPKDVSLRRLALPLSIRVDTEMETDFDPGSPGGRSKHHTLVGNVTPRLARPGGFKFPAPRNSITQSHTPTIGDLTADQVRAYAIVSPERAFDAMLKDARDSAFVADKNDIKNEGAGIPVSHQDGISGAAAGALRKTALEYRSTPKRHSDMHTWSMSHPESSSTSRETAFHQLGSTLATPHQMLSPIDQQRRALRWTFTYRAMSALLGAWVQICCALPFLVQQLLPARNDSSALLILMVAGVVLNAPLLAAQIWLTSDGAPVSSDAIRHVRKSEQVFGTHATPEVTNRSALSRPSKSFSLHILSRDSPGSTPRPSTSASFSSSTKTCVGSVPYVKAHWTAGKVQKDRVVESRAAFRRGMSIAFDPKPKLDVLPPGGRNWTPYKARQGVVDLQMAEEGARSYSAVSEIDTPRSAAAPSQHDPDLSTPGQARHANASQHYKSYSMTPHLPGGWMSSPSLPHGTPDSRQASTSASQITPTAGSFMVSGEQVSKPISSPTTTEFHLDGLSALILPHVVPGIHIGHQTPVSHRSLDIERKRCEEYADYTRRVEEGGSDAVKGSWWSFKEDREMRGLGMSLPFDCPELSVSPRGHGRSHSGAASAVLASLVRANTSDKADVDVHEMSDLCPSRAPSPSSGTSYSGNVKHTGTPHRRRRTKDNALSTSSATCAGDPAALTHTPDPRSISRSMARSTSISLGRSFDGADRSTASNLLPRRSRISGSFHQTPVSGMGDTIELAEEYELTEACRMSPPAAPDKQAFAEERQLDPQGSCSLSESKPLTKDRIASHDASQEPCSPFLQRWAQSVISTADNYEGPRLELAHHVEPLRTSHSSKQPLSAPRPLPSPALTEGRKSLGSSLGLGQFEDELSSRHEGSRLQHDLGLGMPSTLAPPKLASRRGSSTGTATTTFVGPSRPVSDSTRRSLGSDFGLAERVREAVERANDAEAAALEADRAAGAKRMTSDTLAFSDSSLNTELVISPDGTVDIRDTPNSATSSQRPVQADAALLASASPLKGADNLNDRNDEIIDSPELEPFDISNLNVVAQHFHRWSTGPLPPLTEMSEEYASASQSQCHASIAQRGRMSNDWEELNRTLHQIYQRRNRDSFLSEGKASILSASLLGSPASQRRSGLWGANPLSPVGSVRSFGWAEVIQHERSVSLAQLLAIPSHSAASPAARQRVLSNLSLSAVTPRRAIGLRGDFWDHSTPAVPPLPAMGAQQQEALDTNAPVTPSLQVKRKKHAVSLPMRSKLGIDSGGDAKAASSSSTAEHRASPQRSPVRRSSGFSRLSARHTSVSSLPGMAKKGARRLSVVANTAAKVNTNPKSSNLQPRYRATSFSMSEMRSRATSAVSGSVPPGVRPQQLAVAGSLARTPNKNGDEAALFPSSPWMIVNGRPELGDTSQMHEELARLLEAHAQTSLPADDWVDCPQEVFDDRPDGSIAEEFSNVGGMAFHPESIKERAGTSHASCEFDAADLTCRTIIAKVSQATPSPRNASSSSIQLDASVKSKVRHFEKLSSRPASGTRAFVVNSPVRRRSVYQSVTSPDRQSRLSSPHNMRVISQEEWMNDDGKQQQHKPEVPPATQVAATSVLSPTRTKTPRRLPLAALLLTQAVSNSDPWPADTPSRARHLAQMAEVQGACSMMDNADATAPSSQKKRPAGRPKVARRLTEAHLLSTQSAGPVVAGDGYSAAPDENDTTAIRDGRQGQRSRPMPRSQIVTARRI
ncbi:hypothetical protein BCV69DRAFT_87663 [Microstroma glucosiphilum]|uniref:Uncharacterized protein n=1 Tax=Pseudomicrostroma glucosiphilum TaxID=1684307 RepID=A0A316U5E2_9BASI|nr:hypothetical protein BCV69DRAFT_87663 [Pseudomicrostroma glucosiphilum]PWN18175.1 hypothetical protein BCV69DRAFT_87663 [Pseudomicrostroma glucosiphilum]